MDESVSKVIRLYSERLSQNVDALYAMLVALNETQFFPEMYEIFGRDCVIKFLDIFAGQSITIPSREKVERILLKVTLWSDCKNNISTIEELAKEFSMEPGVVADLIDEVDSAMTKVGIITKDG